MLQYNGNDMLEHINHLIGDRWVRDPWKRIEHDLTKVVYIDTKGVASMNSDDKLDLSKGMSELGEFILIGEEWVIYKDQGNPRTGPALFHRCDIKHTRNKYGFHCYERDRRCPVCREIPKGDTLSMIELALGGTWSL